MTSNFLVLLVLYARANYVFGAEQPAQLDLGEQVAVKSVETILSETHDDAKDYMDLLKEKKLLGQMNKAGMFTNVRNLMTAVSAASENNRQINTGSCQDGKFRCSNGDCLPLVLYCDGYNDCGDNSDEWTCSYIRSGQLIALQSAKDSNRWINGYCIANCGENLKTSTTAKCDSCKFRIYSVSRPDPTVIYSGDAVGFRYTSNTWISCQESSSKCGSYFTCKGATCPQETIYNKHNACGAEIFYIKAQTERRSRVIVDGDIVQIQNYAGSCLALGNGSPKIDRCSVNDTWWKIHIL